MLRKIFLFSLMTLIIAACGTKPELPPTQRAFLEAVKKAYQDYSNAPNDLVKDEIGKQAREARAKTTCELLGDRRAAEDWIGTIRTISLSSKGNAGLYISIGGSSTLKTQLEDISDRGDGTLIPKGSKIFTVLSGMKEGQVVRFSGTFFPDKRDCVQELSFTFYGGLSAPEYLFRFTAIEAVE